MRRSGAIPRPRSRLQKACNERDAARRFALELAGDHYVEQHRVARPQLIKGLDPNFDLARLPATVLAGSRMGPGAAFGVAFFSHQVGGFLGIYLGGLLYERADSYDVVWWLGVFFGILSA
jgi:hypothetical protein